MHWKQKQFVQFVEKVLWMMCQKWFAKFYAIDFSYDKGKNVIKYSKLCATVEVILLAFPSSEFVVKSGFSHGDYLLRKQRSTLNIECDLQLKLTNLLPNNLLNGSPNSSFSLKK